MSKIETLCIQGGWQPKNGEPRVLPIYQSTTFNVANKIAALEGGVAAMLTSSGQAANFYAVFNICESGDHFISTSAIYGGTSNLFSVTMKKLGIECTFVDQDASDEEIEKAFRPNTKCVFGETVANPAGKVLDLKRFADLAHKHGVPMIVDNTFPTPILCRPIEFGVDIVTHSTTKYMDGHAMAVGGCIVDSGNFRRLSARALTSRRQPHSSCATSVLSSLRRTHSF